jgi:3-hydroxyisobutyrate dehydrogenase-like beta-hydroxyacid dehydrogenase
MTPASPPPPAHDAPEVPTSASGGPLGPIGLIGVGLVGTALAERLRGAGFPVIGFDTSTEAMDRLRQLGGIAADGPGEVTRRCQRTLISLPDSAIVHRVVTDLRPTLVAGSILVDTTTGDPAHAAALGAALAGSGVDFLDAAICGNSEEVRRREVLVVAGGPASAFSRCTDVFASFARRSFHLGGWGAGLNMKLTTNLVLGLHRAVLAEGLAFAESVGLSPEIALEVLHASSSYSRVMDLKGRKMLTSDFSPQARLSQHLKDVRLMLATGADAGARLPLSDLHRRLLEEAEAAGLGAADNSAIIEVFRKR